MRFDLKKAMFVLPNLFTVSSIFCGFYAVTLCLCGLEPVHLYRAAIAIFFGMFFDMFDGRVARMTRTQSDFGVQLDSLADLITFGVAPAVLLYQWGLDTLGFGGIVVCFLYLACGALRLARFNVLAQRESGSSKYFLGLPIPLAAGTVVATVMASFPLEYPSRFGVEHVVVGTLFLGFLMVSNVRYRTFKDLKLSKKSITLAFVFLLVMAALFTRLKPTEALAALFVGYIGLGMLEEVVFFRRRRRARRAEHSEEDADEEEEEEEESYLEDDEEHQADDGAAPRPA